MKTKAKEIFEEGVNKYRKVESEFANYLPEEEIIGMIQSGILAGLAMQGMIQSAPITDRTKINKKKWARVACEWADALLASMEKGGAR